MTSLRFPAPGHTDSEYLKKKGDIHGLVRLLGHTDRVERTRASEALCIFGDLALPPLINAVNFGTVTIRLGAIEFLGKHNLPGTERILLEIVNHETVVEVKLAALIALGESGGTETEPVLLRELTNKNRYIRYGAAQALICLNRIPRIYPDLVYFSLACEDWERLRSLGDVTTGPLLTVFSDSDPDARLAIISLVQDSGNKNAQQICKLALRDPGGRIRWKAILASMNCGISLRQVPFLTAQHKRQGPDPVAAAILNFLFLGLGYNYIGKWWGFPVFMAYMTIMVLAQFMTDPFLPYLVASPITALLAIHTYGWAVRISERDV